MSNKAIFQCFILAALLLASFAGPGSVQASSSCGNTYVVQPGDWLSTIANLCGVTLAQMYAANPGVGYYIYPGQVLVIPGGYNGSSGTSYSGTYTVQPGDSFSMIARRYGVSISSLWAANPHIWDINRIYPGQVLYVPGSSWFEVVTPSTEPATDLSYGVAPAGTPSGSIKLINNANAEVYVSLQGTTKDGVKVINEYPVSESMRVNVPIGWYTYVAWVGGQKFVGNFTLRKESNYSLKFYSNRVVVE